MTGLDFKLWRVANGLTQGGAARRFGVTQQAVSAWERGKANTGHELPAWVVAAIKLLDEERGKDNVKSNSL